MLHEAARVKRDNNIREANKLTNNKKVPLCDRKRHTACCVVSTHSAVLAGAGGGGTPVLSRLGGVIPVRPWPGGSWLAVPGYLSSWDLGTPTWDWGTSCLGLGKGPGCERTGICENITFPILRMRAVIRDKCNSNSVSSAYNVVLYLATSVKFETLVLSSAGSLKQIVMCTC